MNELCICGHACEQHYMGPVKHRWYCGGDNCKCDLYRPTLPWPDSKGMWWISEWPQPVPVNGIDGELFAWFTGVAFTRDEFYNSACARTAKQPVRFAKLLEGNPFHEKNETPVL